MGRIIDLLFFVVEKILDGLNNSRCHYRTLSHKTTKFYRNSLVENIGGNRNHITIGKHTHVKGELLVHAHGGLIDIGEYCFIGKQAKIWAGVSIKIGNRVLISHNVEIHDNNSHPLSPAERHEHFKLIINQGHPTDISFNEKPIVIEDDVWIGFNSIILKGITIGEGAIIGANSLVQEDVPPFVIAAGNPAKIIRKIENKSDGKIQCNEIKK
jgi:acetyltransferase-like isoleucine patch superfamily enzyme